MERNGAYADEFVSGPEGGVVFHDAALCEQSNLYGMDAFLISKHSLDGLERPFDEVDV